MESDAFKIPLCTNPSTLPNVFPTILCAEPVLQDKQKKACLLSPFEDSMSHLINTHHVLRDRRGRTQRGRVIFASFLLFTDSIKQRVDQSVGPSVLWTRVPLLSMHSHAAPRLRLQRLITHVLHRYLRKETLFGVWSTVWVQLGFVVDFGIWIQTL